MRVTGIISRRAWFVVALIVGAVGLGATVTGSLNTARFYQTATLLNNGMVLIAGGYGPSGEYLAGAELYSPATGTFTPTGSLNTARSLHTATLLNNGLVLIAGGFGSSLLLGSAELYNPATGAFTPTGSLNTARYYHTATLLNNGMVLIAGGQGLGGPLGSAELYNPATGTFAATGSLNTARLAHTATLLNNGMVLIAGGAGPGAIPLAAAELHNPATGTFTPTGSLHTARYFHTATLLNNGMALIAGGYGFSGPSASAELYNPATGTFTVTGSLNTARDLHTATPLNDGTVLIAGGASSIGLASTELYNPVTGTFTPTSSLNTARYKHTATLLNDGMVLLAGGQGPNPPFSLASAELYSLTTTTTVGVNTAPAGLSFTVDSTTYTSAQTFNWVPGTHTIATTSPQGSGGTRYLFQNWSDLGAISHTVTAPGTAVTYTATFATQYLLTTAVGTGGSAAGSISPASGFFNAGTSVSVAAAANPGYAFTGFSGDLTGLANPQSIAMNAQHSVTANFGLLTATAVAAASGQYSDPVTLSATITPASLAVSGFLQFKVNGANVGGPVAVNGSGTYPSPVAYAITQGQGTYIGAITSVFTSTTIGILGSSGANNLVVSREDATVTPSAGNPLAVQVSELGVVTLVAAIEEIADGSLGDISKATPVTFTLIPVVAAPAINCPVITSVTAGVLTATATCPGVPVNVYNVSIVIGGSYYTGSADSMLAVYDPSLGFVTGGGIILHDGVSANFGMTAKYLKNGQIQGSLLYQEHRAEGNVMLKSDSLTTLSVVGNTAVLLGKATLNGVGDYSFQATVTDNGEPGANDRFGLQVTGPGGAQVSNLTFTPITLTGGNIQVPHN